MLVAPVVTVTLTQPVTTYIYFCHVSYVDATFCHPLTHHVVLLAVGLPAPLEELALDLLLAGVALEARLVVHLPERRAPVLLDRLVARPALP